MLVPEWERDHPTQEKDASQPWTPFLCTLVRPNSPKLADGIYSLKWSSARRAADRILGSSQSWLASRVKVPPATTGKTLVVFNQLSWERTDAVVVKPPPGVSAAAVVVRDGNGTLVPSLASRVISAPASVPHEFAEENSFGVG